MQNRDYSLNAVAVTFSLTFGFFLTLGIVVRGLPIAIDMFAPSPISVFQVGVLVAVIGALSGLSVPRQSGGRRMVFTVLLYTAACAVAFAAGLGSIIPVLLTAGVPVFYAAACAAVTAGYILLEREFIDSDLQTGMKY